MFDFGHVRVYRGALDVGLVDGALVLRRDVVGIRQGDQQLFAELDGFEV